MKTIIVDDEPWAIRSFKNYCDKINYLEIVGSFNNPFEALEYARRNTINFAVLDIDMPQMNGLELGKELRKIYPELVLIYVTAYEQYAMEAIRLKADYFLTKPYTKEDIAEIVERAKLLSARQKKQVFIKTFGSFDVFINGELLEFSSEKAKELLALMVDNNGGLVSTEEAMAIIWEGIGDSSLCRTAVMRLKKTLYDNGIEYILSKENNNRSINVDTFDCDYYQFLKGDNKAIWTFTGEYMRQYSWAEITLNSLLKKTGML
ncbi:MAG: response regulator [Erysipelotrichaceae bacterium]